MHVSFKQSICLGCTLQIIFLTMLYLIAFKIAKLTESHNLNRDSYEGISSVSTAKDFYVIHVRSVYSLLFPRG